MRIHDWISLEGPGPSSSKALQSVAEDNWQYFGHDGLPVDKVLKMQSRLHPVNPSLGYKFGSSMNLQSAIAMYLPQPEVYAFIRKEGSQHCVKSHSGKNLGCFPSHGGAVKRLKQVEYFKHKSVKAQDSTYYGPNTGGMGPSKALGSPE